MQKALLAPLALALSAALLLTGCGGGSTPVDPPLPTPTEQAGALSGQITPWAVGKASKVFPVNATIELPGAGFTAQVNAQGQFDLALPNVATMNSTYATDPMPVAEAFALCSSFESNASASLKIAQLNKLETDTGHTLVASSKGGTTFKLWWFASQEATLHMTGQNCVNGNFNTTLALKRGWNIVDMTYDGKTSTYALGTASGRVTWTDTGAATAPLSLNYDFLQTWRR